MHARDLCVNNYVRENKVREVNVREYQSPEKIGKFQCGFFGFSDLRLVDNCLKMTAYGVIVVVKSTKNI